VAAEPSDSCRDEGDSEEQKKNADLPAQRSELLVGRWIESPSTIKNRALPQQSSCGETRHDDTKEEENTHRSESGHLRPGSDIEATVVPHLLNKSQRRPLIRIVGEKVRLERRWTSAGETPARELVRSTR